MKSWHKLFPYSEIRPTQEITIDFAIENFKDKKYIIAELPTGAGKSAIATTLSKYYKSSFILTTQRILQMQYVKDYPTIPNLWSRSNYKCIARPGLSCEMGALINKSVGYSPCECTYDSDKKKFMDGNISLTNLPYFLNVAEYDPNFSKRDLLVVDEAHNLDSQITEFISLKILRGEVEENNLQWVKPNANILEIKNWIYSIILPNYQLQLKTKESLIATNIKSLGNAYSASPEGKTLIKQVDTLERNIKRIEAFIMNATNINEWVITKSSTDDEINIKPIYAGNFTKTALFDWGNKVLLMSGTILDRDTFCRNVGIPISQSAFISLDSEFHKNNRPVIISNMGSMSYKNIDKTLPNMVKAVKQIINDPQHKNTKGILHCQSFKISNYIKENLNDSRLLFHTSENKIEIYKHHMISEKPTILVSPSMSEGVDLINDLSRFQIILKIPFPNLGDEYIKTKMERVDNWYSWQTVKTLIQASGRSVRDKDDWSITYIFDSDWNYFYHKNKKLFPKWYTESIIKL